jgi:hypothetical protein
MCLASFEVVEDDDYRLAGILYCIASCPEGWAEPAVLWELRRMNVARKAHIEGVATVPEMVAIKNHLSEEEFSELLQ